MSRDRSRRALTAALAATATLAAGASAAPAAHAGPTLDILVTNDDGWRGAQTPLIAAVRDALAADGHNVTVVAPATDQSGTGTRLTFSAPLELANPLPRVWTVGGSPGDSVFLGRNVLFADDAPDLVVSGINPGGNFSSIANHSGTVGAAIAALELGVPAIAVSIDGSGAQSVAAKDDAAAYAADLVAALARRARGGDVLPAGIGLNVNYPGATTPTGARITRQDTSSYLRWGYTNTTGAQGAPGQYALSFAPPLAAPARGSDWEALRAGKVSITPIDADRTANDTGAGESLAFLTRIAP